MHSLFVRKIFLSFSDLLESAVKKLRGAAVMSAPQKALTMIDCERQYWKNVRPCFVLSTGRAGTLLLNRLLLLSQNAYAVHQSKPELIRASKRAYEKLQQKPEIFKETFKSAREEMIYEAAVRDKIFIETNNRISFFGPIIREVFPNSVFIHLVRHPGDFVRSGIRRKWYSGEQDHELGRIVPLSGEAKNNWESFSIIEKIGWLWNETNQYIGNFTGQLEPQDFLFIKAEDLFSNAQVTRQIYNFLRLVGFNEKKVKKIIRKPVNIQIKGQFPEFQNWPEEDKKELRQITPLARKYGYWE